MEITPELIQEIQDASEKARIAWNAAQKELDDAIEDMVPLVYPSFFRNPLQLSTKQEIKSGIEYEQISPYYRFTHIDVAEKPATIRYPPCFARDEKIVSKTIISINEKLEKYNDALANLRPILKSAQDELRTLMPFFEATFESIRSEYLKKRKLLQPLRDNISRAQGEYNHYGDVRGCCDRITEWGKKKKATQAKAEKDSIQAQKILGEIWDALRGSPRETYKEYTGGDVAGVYFVFNGKELIYIGQSENIKNRLSGHKHYKSGMRVAWTISEDKQERRKSETLHIRLLRPTNNINGKPTQTTEKKLESIDMKIGHWKRQLEYYYRRMTQ